MRRLVFKSAGFLGSGVAERLESLAYLIKNSRFYRRNQCFACLDRYDLYEEVVRAEKLSHASIDYLEFGVYQGSSLRWWLNRNVHPESSFIGFDTFSGLPERWGGFKQGHFDTGGKAPDVGDDPRCSFEVGLFQDTLPTRKQLLQSSKRKLVHLDADLYSSTLFVLCELGPLLKANDVLFFDDFFSVRKSAHNSALSWTTSPFIHSASGPLEKPIANSHWLSRTS